MKRYLWINFKHVQVAAFAKSTKWGDISNKF